MRGIRDAVGGRRDRCSELGDLVDSEIRSERLEDDVEILEARWHLDAHEDVRERVASDLRRWQPAGEVAMVKHDRIVAGEPRAERRDPGSLNESEQRFSRRHGHVISGPHQRLNQRSHRVVVPVRRTTREEDAHQPTMGGESNSGLGRPLRALPTARAVSGQGTI